MTNSLELVNEIAAKHGGITSTSWVAERLDLSPQGASSLLSRLVRSGVLERVGHGRFVVRPLGALGTSSSAEDISLAVAALFGDRPHRIAFGTAIDHWGLLTHPWMKVQVASTVRVQFKSVATRPLTVISESKDTIHIGATTLRIGSTVSDLERALLECAQRPRLVGGIDIVAEALAAAADKFDVERLASYATRLKMHTGLQRLGSLASRLHLGSVARDFDAIGFNPTRTLLLDPTVRDPDPKRTVRDPVWKVRWNRDLDDIASSVLQ